MSIKVVKEEIARFLESDFPEVLAIRGKWGIGKTYAWKQILKEQKQLEKIKLNHYTYVSLFGISSLQDLKEALFQNMIGTNLIGEKADVSSCAANLKDSLESFGRKSAKVVSELVSGMSTYTKSISTITSLLSFVTVRNSIICIDDFERKGEKLSLKEILGLISQLKEERNCKIVLIYNDEYLLDEKKIYDELKEKVIDAEILYSPLSDESINIVFDDKDDLCQIIRKYAKKLNITNIRVLIKIKRLSLILKNNLGQYDSKILEQAIQTVTLLCFACYSKSEEIPDYEWIKKYNTTTSYTISDRDKDKKSKESKESKWCSILQDYGYLSADPFDLVIYEGVACGYFDREKLIAEAENLSNQYKINHDNSFKKAWELFHNDLSNNQDDFITAVFDGFTQNQKFLSVIDLNSTVVTLKKLNRADLANTLVDSFVEERKVDIEIFNLSDSYYADQITDEYLISKFNSIYKTSQKPDSLQEVLLRIVETHSWRKDDEKYLADVSISDYLNYFKSLSNPFLRKSIQAILRLNITNAKQALISIAKESSINALRIETYGVKLDGD